MPEKSLRAEGAEGADAETIALAKKTNLPLLKNDKALANMAKTHGVRVRWLTLAIIEAAQTKIVTPAQARALIRDLVREGLRVRSEVLAEIIHRIEETQPADGNLQVQTVQPEDPIFTRPPVAKRTGKRERTSTEHDRPLYGETTRSSLTQEHDSHYPVNRFLRNISVVAIPNPIAA